MSRALLVLALSGCVTGAGIVRKDRVTLPILLGAIAADLVIGSLIFAQSDSLSTPGAISSGIALTAVDVGIGCLTGACAVLRPWISRPDMTSRGKRIATVMAVIMLFLLPKHVDCGFPGGECSHPALLRRTCTPYELEPLGFYLIEKLAERNVGFAYTRGETCR